MYHSMNSKGLAEIVSLSLMVLLAVAAAGLVFGIINNLTADLAPEFSCFDAQVAQTLNLVDACYDVDANQVVVQLRRSIDDSVVLTSAEFSISSSGDTVQYVCGSSNEYQCGECVLPLPGATTTYYFDASTLGGIPTVASVTADSCLLHVQDVDNC